MDFRNLSIESTRNLLEALKQMDALDKKLLIVVDKNQYKGLLSAGDIQRAIIKNKSLDTFVFQILRKNIRVGKPGDSFDSIKKMMLNYRMEFCPVVDEGNNILKIHFWEDLFQNIKTQPVNKFTLPVIIMAGGFGTRLEPLTKVLPKPLIPIGNKTMLEEIFERFGKHGCNQFYISVNYKAELIEFYLKNENLPYQLIFIREEKPMGTAGSISLLKGKINQTFFVNNCDILIDQDYSEILNYHYANKNEITIIAALKHYAIPYGIIETGNNGHLIGLTEKPELTFKINSGMYILEPHLIDEIPKNEFFHITQLIELVKRRKGKIGVFPVSEKSWKDIGEAHLLKQYLKAE
ncbi:MAG: nucleotidyltransferase family protein [Flavisolibacter sp.]